MSAEPAQKASLAEDAKRGALELTTDVLKGGQAIIVGGLEGTVDKHTKDDGLINKIFNKYKNADLNAFEMLDNASKDLGNKIMDMKIGLELDQDDELRQY